MTRVLAKAQERDLFAGMNKTERDWAKMLESLRKSGDVREWHYEAVTLKVGEDCRYTPDFMVVYPDGHIGFDEVKGFWRDDAKVKIRTAAKQFPFVFRAVQREKSNRFAWDVTDYTHRESQ
jgi:hypothetical protein